MDIQSVKKDLEGIRSDLSDLKSALAESSDMSELSKIAEDLSEVQRNDLRMSDIEAVPGARTPKWYTLDIDYLSGETQSKARALEISPDGVFVCTQMQAYYKVLDRNEDHYPPTFQSISPFPGDSQIDFAYGRYLPCTAAYPFLAGIFYNPVQVAGTTQNTDLNPGEGNYFYPIPEFSFQMEVVGSGVFWTSKPIPSASLFGVTEPKYLGMSAYLDRGERLVVTAKPETRVPLTGKVRFVLHGYQILGNIDLSKYLG